MHEELIDQIYEAAFQPECWTNVLKLVGARAGSASGLVVVFDEIKPIRYRGTPIIENIIRAFCEVHWRDSRRASHTLNNPFTGFVRLKEYFPPDLLETDPCRVNRLSAGLDCEASAAIAMPTGELVVYSFDKWLRDGPHEQRDINALNRFLPHLARAGLMAARLGLERAVATTTALQVIGLPAAVLTGSGRVLSTNALFDDLASVFLPVAFGRVAIANIGANRLFQEAIETLAASAPTVRSIPIAETEQHHACIVHLVPLRRSAHDIFPGGDLVVAVSALKRSALVPSPAILTGLFDLTPAEAKFASALVSGRSIKEAARDVGVTESSGRTYLARIFSKTGTHRQAELVALLAASHPFEDGTELAERG
jgi:DNA-binding CsgD family transcriptional regulator